MLGDVSPHGGPQSGVEEDSMQGEGNYEQRVSLEYFSRKNVFHY
jgi:hypothetical protein